MRWRFCIWFCAMACLSPNYIALIFFFFMKLDFSLLSIWELILLVLASWFLILGVLIHIFFNVSGVETFRNKFCATEAGKRFYFINRSMLGASSWYCVTLMIKTGVLLSWRQKYLEKLWVVTFWMDILWNLLFE